MKLNLIAICAILFTAVFSAKSSYYSILLGNVEIAQKANDIQKMINEEMAIAYTEETGKEVKPSSSVQYGLKDAEGQFLLTFPRINQMHMTTFMFGEPYATMSNECKEALQSLNESIDFDTITFNFNPVNLEIIGSALVLKIHDDAKLKELHQKIYSLTEQGVCKIADTYVKNSGANYKVHMSLASMPFTKVNDLKGMAANALKKVQERLQMEMNDHPIMKSTGNTCVLQDMINPRKPFDELTIKPLKPNKIVEDSIVDDKNRTKLMHASQKLCVENKGNTVVDQGVVGAYNYNKNIIMTLFVLVVISILIQLYNNILQ